LEENQHQQSTGSTVPEHKSNYFGLYFNFFFDWNFTGLQKWRPK